MSDKTKLLPCPFCGCQPKKRKSYGDERDGYADHVSYICQNCGCCRGAAGDSEKGGYADNSKVEELALSAWNTRAPAEDVRAVGDEPTDEMCEAGCQAYMEADGSQWVMHKSSMAHTFKAMSALYRPQRRVVFPERKEVIEAWEPCDVIPAERAKGWNDYLDEFERLNPK